MDYLFGEEISSKISQLKVFKIPDNKEIIDYLRQTQGVMSQDICELLQIKLTQSIETLNRYKYHGPLTVQQQVFIIQDLLN